MGCCGRLFYDDVSIQVPPVAESHCKFRLWKCLGLAERGGTVGL